MNECVWRNWPIRDQYLWNSAYAKITKSPIKTEKNFLRIFLRFSRGQHIKRRRLSYRLAFSVVWVPQKFTFIQNKNSSFLIVEEGYVLLRQAQCISQWYHTALGKHWLRSMKSFSTWLTIKKYLRFENNEIIIVEKNESHHEICLDFTIFFV